MLYIGYLIILDGQSIKRISFGKQVGSSKMEISETVFLHPK